MSPVCIPDNTVGSYSLWRRHATETILLLVINCCLLLYELSLCVFVPCIVALQLALGPQHPG